jgi:competence protein ComEC
LPLLWSSLAFLAGILVGKWFSISPIIWGGGTVVTAAWLVVDRIRKHAWWKKALQLPPAWFLALICLGALRVTLAAPVVNDHSLAYYNDRGTAALTGWVSEPPDVREDAVYARLKVTELERMNEITGETGSLPVKGDVRVRFQAGFEVRMGDILRFSTEPLTPSDGADFSYRDYLYRQGIQSVVYYPTEVKTVGTHPVDRMRLWLEALRQKARTTIFRLFPQPESGLLSGILLGLDNDLPESLNQAYRDTGTAHIIAISGFNMAVLAGLLMALTSRFFNRYTAAALTALGLAFYTVLVGGSPSVVRAAVMASVAMGGHLIGRRSAGPTALFFTAFIMCLVNPFLPWDTSFQLSFAATLGLILLGSPLKDRAEKAIGHFVPVDQVHRIAGPLSEYFLFTLAAQAATLPIIALQFKRLSISSLLSNPLVLPVQPAVLVTGGVATIAGMVYEPLGRLGAFAAWPLLAYTNRIVAWIARMSGEAIAVDSRLSLGIGIASLGAFMIIVSRDKLKKWLGGISFVWIALALMAAAVSIWAAVLHRPDGYLHLELIRSGSEVNQVITSPGGSKVVLNPGEEVNELTSSISQSLNPWRNRVDGVLLTQRSSARYLSAFDERLPVHLVYLAPSVTRPVEGLRPINYDPSLSSQNLSVGDVLTMDDGVTIHVLTGDTDADALLVTYRGCRILIPGGVDPARLVELDPRVLAGLTAIVLAPADITRVPPHWWERWSAGQILWQDLSQAPEQSWISLGSDIVLELISDGSAYSLFTR